MSDTGVAARSAEDEFVNKRVQHFRQLVGAEFAIDNERVGVVVLDGDGAQLEAEHFQNISGLAMQVLGYFGQIGDLGLDAVTGAFNLQVRRVSFAGQLRENLRKCLARPIGQTRRDCWHTSHVRTRSVHPPRGRNSEHRNEHSLPSAQEKRSQQERPGALECVKPLNGPYTGTTTSGGAAGGPLGNYSTKRKQPCLGLDARHRVAIVRVLHTARDVHALHLRCVLACQHAHTHVRPSRQKHHTSSRTTHSRSTSSWHTSTSANTSKTLLDGENNCGCTPDRPQEFCGSAPRAKGCAAWRCLWR